MTVPFEDDPEDYNHDDTSANGTIDREDEDEEGPEWDELGGYPEDSETADDDEDEGDDDE